MAVIGETVLHRWCKITLNLIYYGRAGAREAGLIRNEKKLLQRVHVQCAVIPEATERLLEIQQILNKELHCQYRSYVQKPIFILSVSL